MHPWFLPIQRAMKLLKLPLNKEMSLGTWTLKRPQSFERLRVPVYSDAPFYQNPCVAPGQLVSCGMIIAQPRSSAGIPVFSPVNGLVTEMARGQTAAGESVLTIEIQVDKKNIGSFLIPPENSVWLEATAERLRCQIREAGVVLCGRLPKPLSVFLEKGPFHDKALIVNACESEPYVTAGQVLLLAHPLEILKGAEILRRAAGLKEIIIALPEDAGQAIDVLKSKIYFLKWEHVKLRIFPSRFPQDDPAVLMPSIDAKFSDMDPKRLHEWPLPDLVTVYAAYEAVVLGKPFFERAVTVTGECVVQPQNVLLPMGIMVTDALKVCKGVLREPGRMIAGGPMRGRAVISMNDPLSPATDALIALPKENSAEKKAVECIRCGECADVCPVDLSPALIAMASAGQSFESARELGSQQCIACGNCAYICPSHLPLVEMIRDGF